MNQILFVLLAGTQGSGLMNIVFLVSIIVVFYLFMIRPQVRKQKTEKQFRETLQKGAKVVTIGGIHGRIVEVSDRTFLVEIDTNVKVRVERSAISAEATRSLDNPATPAKT
ncbi:MAG: preprotein translocase subunit YajC [Bacteroidia bacterium]|nr:preprotein translocase subunit YajC [Bacteroidia bacterium]